MKFNIFLGLYTFSIWINLFFMDVDNVDDMTPMKMFFNFGSDFYRTLSSLFLEIKKDFEEIENIETFNY